MADQALVEGARHHRHDQAAGVPRSSWSSSDRRRTRDGRRPTDSGWIGDFVDAINFLDLWTVQVGEQQHQLVQPGRTTPSSQGEEHLGQRQRATSCTAGRGHPERPERRDGRSLPIYWYTYANLEQESVNGRFVLTVNLLSQTDLTKVVVTSSPASTHGTRTEPTAARPRWHAISLHKRGKGESMLEVHRSVRMLSGRSTCASSVVILTDLPDDAADRGKPVPAYRSARSRGGQQANLERKFNLDRALVACSTCSYVKGVFTFDLGPSLVAPRPGRQRHRQGALPGLDRARRLRVHVRDLPSACR